jgi:hypothetical protein
MRESIGGNAGEMHLCVNAVANRQTGEIIKFSNHPEDYKNPNSGEVQLRVEVKDLEKIKLFIGQIYFEGEFTKEAKQNIISAVEMKNKQTA